jgi:hypothetical protein
MTNALHAIGLPAAAVLMALLAALCLVAAVTPVVVAGPVALPAGAVAALGIFQALRVPVGRASSWLIDG